MLLATAALASMPVLPVGGLTGVTHNLVTEMALFLSGRERPYQRGEWTALPTCRACVVDDTARDHGRHGGRAEVQLRPTSARRPT